MRRIALLTFGLLVLQAMPAQAEPPDVVAEGTCSFAQQRAGVRLELTDIGDRIKVRVEVQGSRVGHSWHIVLRHAEVSIAPPGPGDYQVFFEGTRLASDSGELAVQRPIQDRATHHAFKTNAVDTQTGQVCKAHGGI